MRVLLFGAQGQVGRELVARAPGANVSLLGLGRADIDLADSSRVAELVLHADADIVVNAAAYTAVDLAEANEEAAFAVNADAPGAMASACRARGLPLVHISTDYVFDGSGADALTEHDPTGPINVYGRSKLAGELAVADAGARSLTIRTSWVFSPHGRNFVKTMLGLADRPALTVVDDQVGRPTFAGDIAEFILLAAKRMVGDGDFDGGGLVHFAGEGATSWRRFAEAIFMVAGPPAPDVRPILTVDYPTAARRPMNSVLDCGKVQRIYGVTPRPWRDGLAETIETLRVSGEGATK